MSIADESGRVTIMELGQILFNQSGEEAEKLRDYHRKKVTEKKKELDAEKKLVKTYENYLVLLASFDQWKKNSRYYEWGGYSTLINQSAEVVRENGEVKLINWKHALLREWLDISGKKKPKGFVVLESIDDAKKVNCPKCKQGHLLIFESHKYRDSPVGDSSGWEFNVYCDFKKISISKILFTD